MRIVRRTASMPRSTFNQYREFGLKEKEFCAEDLKQEQAWDIEIDKQCCVLHTHISLEHILG